MAAGSDARQCSGRVESRGWYGTSAEGMVGMDEDDFRMCSAEESLEEPVAELELRSQRLESVLLDLEVWVTTLTDARAAARWSGPAATAFGWSADELGQHLRTAASSLDVGAGLARGAAMSAILGGHG
jgi:hypothetical protein